MKHIYAYEIETLEQSVVPSTRIPKKQYTDLLAHAYTVGEEVDTARIYGDGYTRYDRVFLLYDNTHIIFYEYIGGTK